MIFKKDVEEKREALKIIITTKPGELKSFASWQDWWELWDNYCSQVIGSADVPLRYVYRPESDVSEDSKNADYPTQEEWYVNNTILARRHYQLDNIRV